MILSTGWPKGTGSVASLSSISEVARGSTTGLPKGTASPASACSQIIAFRNILIHAYDAVDDRVVWEAVTDRLPILLDEVRGLLEDPNEKK